MATKTTNSVPDTEKKTVTVKLPLTRDRQDDVFVGVNGESILIQRGKEVEIEKKFYEVLKNSEDMDELALTRRLGQPNR